MDDLHSLALLGSSWYQSLVFGVRRALALSAQIRRCRTEYPLVTALRRRSVAELGPGQAKTAGVAARCSNREQQRQQTGAHLGELQ